MDYRALDFWLDLGQAGLTAGLGIYFWLVTRTRVNAGRIRRLEEDLDDQRGRHEERLTRLEERFEQGVTRGDLQSIHERIDGIDSSLSRLAGEFHGAKGTLDLIHQFLLNEGTR